MTLGLVNEDLLKGFRPLGTVATGLILKYRPQLPKTDRAGGNLRQVYGEAVGDVLLYEVRDNHKEVRLHERNQHFAEVGRCEFVAVLSDFLRMGFLYPLTELPCGIAISEDKQSANIVLNKLG